MHALKTCQVIKSPEKVFMKYFRTKPSYIVLDGFLCGFCAAFAAGLKPVSPRPRRSRILSPQRGEAKAFSTTQFTTTSFACPQTSPNRGASPYTNKVSSVMSSIAMNGSVYVQQNQV